MIKKGQITFFVVMAILLIVGIIIIFFIKSGSFSVDKAVNSQVSEIDEAIQGCTESALLSGARLVGLQGGFAIVPGLNLTLNSSNMGYGFYEGDILLPSLTRIENEIASYIDLMLPFCLESSDFSNFELSEKFSSSVVSIDDNIVIAYSDFFVFIVKEDETFLIDKTYEVEIDLQLKKIHEVASEIVSKEKADPDFIDLDYLTSSEFDIDIIPYSDDIIIYSIVDRNSELNGVPYVFRFGNKIR
ncbi:MAG: hypothetical protein KKF56_04550 [Nanoarchaeota archaeon]|nr:hypothetical protein [Nanoarchaeota archaeon]